MELDDDGGADVHADDREKERGVLPSDDEEGPPDPDEDADALPPGNVDAAGEELEDAGTALEDGAEAGGAPAAACPPLPAVLGLMKNEEMKEQLRWRGLPIGGNKADLLSRLEKAVADGVRLLDELPDQAGRAAAAQATSGLLPTRRRALDDDGWRLLGLTRSPAQAVRRPALVLRHLWEEPHRRRSRLTRDVLRC